MSFESCESLRVKLIVPLLVSTSHGLFSGQTHENRPIPLATYSPDHKDTPLSLGEHCHAMHWKHSDKLLNDTTSW